MPAKYAYCEYGHPRPLYMEACPSCVTKSVTKRPNNVTPVTKLAPPPSDGAEAVLAAGSMPNTVSHRGSSASSPGVGVPRRGRPRKHETNAERQAAYRERR